TSVTRPASSPGASTPSSDGGSVATATPRSRTSPASAPGSARSPAAAITRVAPAASVTHTSDTAASKLNEANASTFTPPVTPNTGPCATVRFTTPPWVTCTPFGAPVDPEVYITYASWPATTPAPGGGQAGAAATAATVSGSSSVITRIRPAGSSSTIAAVPASTLAWLSASMNASRPAGYPGSSGRYAPPAFHTASIATTMPAPRSRHNPTTDSPPTPTPRGSPPSRSARSSSPPYLSDTPPHVTATTSGPTAARAAASSCTPPAAGTGTGVAVHRADSSRSPPVSAPSPDNGRPGSAATAASSTPRCPATRPIVAAANNAVLYSSPPDNPPPSSAKF